MANVYDVTQYILRSTGKITAMKLQKLVYYSQAWHATWTGHPLYAEQTEAWANGPVVRELFNYHKGLYAVTPETFPLGNADQLTDDEADSVDRVVAQYGKLSALQLSMVSHAEGPWQDARDGVAGGDSSTNVIPVDAMRVYYQSMRDDPDLASDFDDVDFPEWTKDVV